jgi:Na+-driven multidrug efflux pump
MRITFFGTPFMMIGFGMAHCTRAQGFPGITMITMLLGAVLNIILDPIFIFVLRLGVEGVAWATIISQSASVTWILIFILRGKTVLRLKLRTFRPSIEITSHIMAFGSAQFLLNFIMSGVQLLTNMSMGWYGASSLGVDNGGDIALSAMNIIGTLTMFILMPVFGINQGVQPILGYNYGAKQFRRVLQAYTLAVISSTIICILGFSVAELFPMVMVRLFAPQGSPVLLNFASWAMRVSLICLPLNGFQIVSSNFFVVTGRPKMSIFLTVLRQFIALIPCLLIFGRLWGVWGIAAANPVADGFSFILTGTLIFFELKKLRGQLKEPSVEEVQQ